MVHRVAAAHLLELIVPWTLTTQPCRLPRWKTTKYTEVIGHFHHTLVTLQVLPVHTQVGS